MHQGTLECESHRLDLSDKRLEKAQELGADETINAGRERLEHALLGDTVAETAEQNVLGSVSAQPIPSMTVLVWAKILLDPASYHRRECGEI